MSAPAFAVLGLGEAGGGSRPTSSQRAPRCAASTRRRRRCRGVARAADPAAAAARLRGRAQRRLARRSLRGAAAAALPALAPGAVYADLNTAAPALKRELAALVEPAGRRASPTSPCSARCRRAGCARRRSPPAPGAEAFAALLGPLGMPVEVVSDEPGDAAALQAPALRLHEGPRRRRAREPRRRRRRPATRTGSSEQLAEAIGAALLSASLEGSRRHAARRVEEMDAAASCSRELGVEPRIAAASGAPSLADLGAARVAGDRPESEPTRACTRARPRRLRPARPHRARRARRGGSTTWRSRAASRSSASPASRSSRTTPRPPSVRRSSRASCRACA